MDGIRKSKTVGNEQHTYLTESGKVMRETIGTGSTAKILDFVYDDKGMPFALCYSTNNGQTYTDYYYITNLQGDVVRLVNSAGSTVANYTYDAWGDLLSVTNSSGSSITNPAHIANLNPLRYRGYYYDNETGWYYLQSRYYDPEVGRFINADLPEYAAEFSIDDNNLFAYCANNPIGFKDDGGMQRVAIIYDANEEKLFTNYAETMQKVYGSEGDFVVLFPVYSVEGFMTAWDSLGYGKYDHVEIACHGGKGALFFGGQSIGIGESGLDYLADIKINKSLKVLSCNGGTNYNGTSVAQQLSNKAYVNATGVFNAKCYYQCYKNDVVKCTGYRSKDGASAYYTGRWKTFHPSAGASMQRRQKPVGRRHATHSWERA